MSALHLPQTPKHRLVQSQVKTLALFLGLLGFASLASHKSAFSLEPGSCQNTINCCSKWDKNFGKENFGDTLSRLFVSSPYSKIHPEEEYAESENEYSEAIINALDSIGGSRLYTWQELPTLYRPVSISLADLKGKRVISLGEGDSDLVASLNSEGVIAYGTDFDYSASKLKKLAKKKKNISKVLNRYFFVDATRADSDVREVLGAEFQADHIFSHTLLCCLTQEMALETMVRAHRLLKVGGTFRSFIIHHWERFYGKHTAQIDTQERIFLLRLNERFNREKLNVEFALFRQGVATILIMTKI